MFYLITKLIRRNSISTLHEEEEKFKSKVQEKQNLESKIKSNSADRVKEDAKRRLVMLNDYIAVKCQTEKLDKENDYATTASGKLDKNIAETKLNISTTRAQKENILESSTAKTIYKRYCHYKHYIPKAYKEIDRMNLLLKEHFLSDTLKNSTLSTIRMIKARISHAKDIVEEIKSFYEYVDAATKVDRKMAKIFDKLRELEVEKLYYDKYYVLHHMNLDKVATQYMVENNMPIGPRIILGRMLYQAVVDMSSLDVNDYFLEKLRKQHLNFITQLIRKGADFYITPSTGKPFHILECSEIHSPNVLETRNLIIAVNQFGSDIVIEQAIIQSRKFYNYGIIISLCNHYIKPDDAFRIAINTGHFEVATSLIDNFKRLDKNAKNLVNENMSKKFVSELKLDIGLLKEIKTKYNKEYKKVSKLFDENDYFMEGYKLLVSFEEGSITLNNLNYNALLETAAKTYFEFLSRDEINDFLAYRSKALEEVKSLEHRHTLMLQMNKICDNRLLPANILAKDKEELAISGLSISLD